MKSIYLENYKGFSKALIPLKKVNFLVGENSSGKTTILNLLNLLNSYEFWASNEFNTDSLELGYFDEIINQYAKEKKIFKIGVEYSIPAMSKTPSFFLMSYENNQNIPQLCNIRLLLGSNDCQIKVEKKSTSYQTRNFKNRSFEEWITDDLFTGKSKNFSNQHFHRNGLHYLIYFMMAEIDREYTHHLPMRFEDLNYFAPIRAKTQRIYENYKKSHTPEGTHIPSKLNSILSKKSTKNLKTITTFNQFGKESGLFDEIAIKKYGKGEGSAFAINIQYNDISTQITNVGYGVSQIMPLLVEISDSQRTKFSIQQPEVHLHPKAQAYFGEFIHNSAHLNKNEFIIETHSDYTINRYRHCLYKCPEASISSQIIYFERTSAGTAAISLELGNKGEYPDNMPDGYSAFFIDEELKMLEF